jgi:flagellar protein FlgJ
MIAVAPNKALAELRASADPKQAGEIQKVAEEFESLFLNIVLKSMRDTVQKSGLIDGGNAENIYQSMLDDEYAKTMATQRHTGLADNIESFLLTAVQGMRQASENAGKPQGIKAYQASSLQEPEKPAKIEDGAPSLPPTATIPRASL